MSGRNQAKLETLEDTMYFGDVTSSDIASYRGLSLQNASVRLRRAYKQGLLCRERDGRTYIYSITSNGEDRYHYLIFKRNEEIIIKSAKKRCPTTRSTHTVIVPIEMHVSEPQTLKKINVFEYYKDRRCPVPKKNKINPIKPFTNVLLTPTKNVRIFQDVQKCRIIKEQKIESIWDNVNRCRIVDENDDLDLDSPEPEDEEEEEDEEDVVSLFERLSQERCKVEDQ